MFRHPTSPEVFTKDAPISSICVVFNSEDIIHFGRGDFLKNNICYCDNSVPAKWQYGKKVSALHSDCFDDAFVVLKPNLADARNHKVRLELLFMILEARFMATIDINPLVAVSIIQL